MPCLNNDKISIVGYIFFTLFQVVDLRKKCYFGKEKEYSTQSSVYLEQFCQTSGHVILWMTNVAMWQAVISYNF